MAALVFGASANPTRVTPTRVYGATPSPVRANALPGQINGVSAQQAARNRGRQPLLNYLGGPNGPGVNSQAAQPWLKAMGLRGYVVNPVPGELPTGTPGQNASGASKPPTPQASPLDSTYYLNTAANTFKVNNDVNALNLANSQANTALQAALAQLAYQQPRDQLKLEQAANNRGALYSSVYDQNLGDLNYQYAGKQGGAIDKFAQTEAANQAKIAADEGSIPLYNAQQALASATRSAQQAAKNPATGNGILKSTTAAKTTNTVKSSVAKSKSKSVPRVRTTGTGARYLPPTRAHRAPQRARTGTGVATGGG